MEQEENLSYFLTLLFHSSPPCHGYLCSSLMYFLFSCAFIFNMVCCVEMSCRSTHHVGNKQTEVEDTNKKHISNAPL